MDMQHESDDERWIRSVRETISMFWSVHDHTFLKILKIIGKTLIYWRLWKRKIIIMKTPINIRSITRHNNTLISTIDRPTRSLSMRSAEDNMRWCCVFLGKGTLQHGKSLNVFSGASLSIVWAQTTQKFSNILTMLKFYINSQLSIRNFARLMTNHKSQILVSSLSQWRSLSRHCRWRLLWTLSRRLRGRWQEMCSTTQSMSRSSLRCRYSKQSITHIVCHFIINFHLRITKKYISHFSRKLMACLRVFDSF